MIAAPSEIAQATVETWPTLWPATKVTLLEGSVGFLLAVACGILIGILLYCSRIANAALFPLLSAAQTMPLISIAPLFLIWFGFEISGKIVIVAVFGLFPIAVQTVRGLEAVPQFYSDVALTCGATRAWTLWHVKLRVAARRFTAASAYPPHTSSPPPPLPSIWVRARVSASGCRQLQFVPHAADLLGHAGHHRHHRHTHVPRESQRTPAARPSRRGRRSGRGPVKTQQSPLRPHHRHAHPYNGTRCLANVWQTGNVPQLRRQTVNRAAAGIIRNVGGIGRAGALALRIVFCPNPARSVIPRKR